MQGSLRRKSVIEIYSYNMHVFCTQSCQTLCDPLDCSLPGSSVHGILQASILEWVVISYSRGSSWPRDQTHDSCLLQWQAGSLPPCHLASLCSYSTNQQLKSLNIEKHNNMDDFQKHYVQQRKLGTKVSTEWSNLWIAKTGKSNL